MLHAAFDKQSLAVQLADLDEKGQRVLGLLCCERLLPNYLEFQTETGSGDSNPLKEAVEVAWASIKDKVADSKIDQLSEQCESMAPGGAESDSLFVTPAQDACFAICCVLDHVLASEPERIAQVLTYATDSVDLYVQEIEGMHPNDPNLEQLILAHPLMQQELAAQDRDLTMIREALNDTEKLIALRKKSDKGNLRMHS